MKFLTVIIISIPIIFIFPTISSPISNKNEHTTYTTNNEVKFDNIRKINTENSNYIFTDSLIAINDTNESAQLDDTGESSKLEDRGRVVKIAPLISYNSLIIKGYEYIKNRDAFILTPQAEVIPGVQFSVDNFSVSIYNSFPYKNKNEEETFDGLKKFSSVETQFYQDTAGIELYFKRESGYILHDKSKQWIPSVKKSREDIDVIAAGGNLLFSTDFVLPTKVLYSFKKGMGHAASQKKDFTAAFSYMVYADYISVKSKTPFDPRSTSYDTSVLKNVEIYNAYVTPGYAFSASDGGLYFSGSLFICSIGVTMAKYNDPNGTRTTTSWNFLQWDVRCAAGYDGVNYFSGANFIYKYSGADLEFESSEFANMNLETHNIKFEVFSGIKF